MIKTNMTIGLPFNSEQPLNKISLYFPESTQIISVDTKKGKPILYINFSANTEMFASNLWKEISFFVHKCNSVEVDLSKLIYIGEINVGNDLYEVYYTKGLIADY